MRRKRNFKKEIVLLIIFCVEVIFTILGFYNSWSIEFKIAFLFADILTVFNGLLSILNKLDNEMQNEMKKEHGEIKSAIELYKDIENEEYVAYFEGNYINSQKKSGVEMWIISNCVAEPVAILKEMLKNVRKGVTYYYVIPKQGRAEKDIKNTFDVLCSKLKSNENLILKYIQDDLFDFIPTDIVDIVFYCNPASTDYLNNMKIFYSFQNNGLNMTYYKPIIPSEKEIQRYFENMESWKKREWKTLEYTKK